MSVIKYAIGVDMGGTNTDIGLVDERGVCVDRRRISTASYPKIQLFINDLIASISDLLNCNSVSDIEGIGIGAPNANFFTGEIHNAPNLNFEGDVKLKELIEKEIPTQVVLTNDANAAAYGEMLYGGARQMKDFIMITLGTGVGSGIVINGNVLYGHDGMAGELGHTIVFPNGRKCSCGRKGCLEEYASARGIRQTCQELIQKHDLKSSLYYFSLENLGCKVIGDAAENGDPLALEVLRYTGYVLGLALSNAVAFSSPQAIFLMGGPTKSGDLISPVKKYFEENLLSSYRGKIDILLSALNENDAAILGAAALAVVEKDKIK